MSLPTRSAYLAFCAKQVGETEHPPGSNHQKFGEFFGWNGVAWCQIADWYTAIKMKMKHLKTASTMAAVADARKNGTWHPGLAGIQPCDSVYLHWPTSTRPHDQPDHVETCKYRITGGIRTYGGNVADGYREQNRRANIIGYIRHTFAAEPVPKGLRKNRGYTCTRTMGFHGEASYDKKLDYSARKGVIYIYVGGMENGWARFKDSKGNPAAWLKLDHMRV